MTEIENKILKKMIENRAKTLAFIALVILLLYGFISSQIAEKKAHADGGFTHIGEKMNTTDFDIFSADGKIKILLGEKIDPTIVNWQKTTDQYGNVIYTSPDGGVSVVARRGYTDMIKILSNTYKTARGLTIGSSKADFDSVYGLAQKVQNEKGENVYMLGWGMYGMYYTCDSSNVVNKIYIATN